jgi:hypothetical protein
MEGMKGSRGYTSWLVVEFTIQIWVIW